MNKLTVVLTVLNEGVELQKTLESLVKSADAPFDIILINDCSNDGFDYEKVAVDYGAKYVEHDVRKGPAFSRDEGIALCSTEYFLLIDAHMRVYQDFWCTRIVDELQREENVLLCCSTIALSKNAVSLETGIGYGAIIDLQSLDARWKNDIAEDDTIPCIYGASYACSRKYWIDLNGLDGLKLYGFEEQLISLKVWLNGGKCKVLKDVCFGHIFRDELPASYEIPVDAYFFNQLLIVELIYDVNYKSKFIKYLRKERGTNNVNSWIEEFAQRRQEISERKKMNKEMFTRDFDFIINLNTTKK